MNLLGINKTLSPRARAVATEFLLGGETIREVAARVNRGLGSIQRLRIELVGMGLLAGRAPAKKGAWHRRSPRSKTATFRLPVKTGSEFIAPIPLSRLMAGR